MCRINTNIAVVLCTLLLISICSAQQTSSSDNKQTNSGQNSSPIGIDGPVIGGDGTPNYIPIWATPGYLLSSVIYQDSTGKVGIATTTPMAKLDVNGHINTDGWAYQIGGSNVVSIGSADDFNLFVGIGAGVNNVGGQGSYNAFLGYDAGNSNSTGTYNVFSGNGAGYSSTSGDGNVFVGFSAGALNRSGGYNTYIGTDAGYNNNGSANTFVGFSAGTNPTGDNNIYIGYLGVSSESNTIHIGGDNGRGFGPQTKTFIEAIYGSTSSGGIPVYINSNGRLGTTTSSLRFKEQVRDMGDSTSALMKLRPVTFRYKPEYADGERTLQYGLIAEEVAQVYPELVADDKDGQPYSVRYQYLSTMLLNEVQKQYRRAQEQTKVIETQQREIESLKQQLQLQNATLQERLSRLEKLTDNQVRTVAQK
jgi:hypothetical protein